MGFKSLWSLIAVLLLSSVSTPLFAQPTVPDPEEAIAFDQFVVKVRNISASIFSPVPQSGHGTGFIYDIDEEADRVIVFTNHHVIAADLFQVQKIEVEVTDDSEMPEIVDATILYASPLHDFGVVEFRLSDLTRTRKRLRQAPIPLQGEQMANFSQDVRFFKGRKVIAFGNPFDGVNVHTEGVVSAIWSASHTDSFTLMGTPFIQTTAPINPGNSGGPLIDVESGQVIGMNSAGRIDGSNVGYALPIGQMLSDFSDFLINPALQYEKTSTIMFGIGSISDLKLSGELPAVLKEIPDFDKRFHSILRVQDSRNPLLKTGDLVVAVNGQAIGASFYRLQVLAAHANTLRLTVIRQGKSLTVEVSTPSEAISRLRESVDFVYLSGILMTQANARQIFAGGRDIESNVRVALIDEQNSEVQFSGAKLPGRGSVIVGISLEHSHYPIKTLLDLKKALNAHPSAKSARLEVRESVMILDRDDNPVNIMNRYQSPALTGSVTYTHIPITEPITPANFSMQNFKRQFSFAPQDSHTRDWRDFVEERTPPFRLSCNSLLQTTAGGESPTPYRHRQHKRQQM